jgi:hypothetical protein
VPGCRDSGISVCTRPVYFQADSELYFQADSEPGRTYLSSVLSARNTNPATAPATSSTTR